MTSAPPLQPDATSRQHAGKRADLFGRSAEDRVAQTYLRRGADLLARRWRGSAGEIDLIFREAGAVVFVEVKAAKSINAAIASLRSAQMRRIHAAAEEFLATEPSGSLTDVRFDLACCDQYGRTELIENAFGHF
ncbi:YraN family protein [Thalassovita sp.]|uniref:YraN family protein n=1 Tax=Thalassovita sp. TaxID=1979401 RepID=UPI0029DE5662|nr:YraN family protein [Thalassovita sp.]